MDISLWTCPRLPPVPPYHPLADAILIDIAAIHFNSKQLSFVHKLFGLLLLQRNLDQHRTLPWGKGGGGLGGGGGVRVPPRGLWARQWHPSGTSTRRVRAPGWRGRPRRCPPPHPRAALS